MFSILRDGMRMNLYFISIFFFFFGFNTRIFDFILFFLNALIWQDQERKKVLFVCLLFLHKFSAKIKFNEIKGKKLNKTQQIKCSEFYVGKSRLLHITSFNTRLPITTETHKLKGEKKMCRSRAKRCKRMKRKKNAILLLFAVQKKKIFFSSFVSKRTNLRVRTRRVSMSAILHLHLRSDDVFFFFMICQIITNINQRCGKKAHFFKRVCVALTIWDCCTKINAFGRCFFLFFLCEKSSHVTRDINNFFLLA
jgi:hypothetical protein